MDNNPKIITAAKVTLTVTDAATGQIYTRELPLDYYETAYCLRLKGEDLNGRPAELVFYSASGVEKLKDLTGGGPDQDRCHNN